MVVANPMKIGDAKPWVYSQAPGCETPISAPVIFRCCEGRQYVAAFRQPAEAVHIKSLPTENAFNAKAENAQSIT
jgi:hypothetical protein